MNNLDIVVVKEGKIDNIPTLRRYQADVILEEKGKDYFYLYKSREKKLWNMVDKNRLIKKELFNNLLKGTV